MACQLSRLMPLQSLDISLCFRSVKVCLVGGPVPDNLKGLAVGRLSHRSPCPGFLLLFSFPCHNMLPSIIFVLALSLPISVLAVSLWRDDEPLHIPLVRRRNVRRNDRAVLDHYVATSNGLRAKYGIGQPPIGSSSRRAQTGDVGITNQVRLPSTTDSSVRLTILTQQGRGYKLLYPSQRRLSVSAKPYQNVFALPTHLCFSVLFSEPRNSISSLTQVPQICGLPPPAAPAAVRTPQC